MRKILLALCFITMLKIQAQINTNTQTQADTAVYALTDINDKEYLGTILSDDGRELLMMTQTMGKIYFKKTDIKKLTLLSKKEIEKREYNPGAEDEIMRESPISTRYAFTANAFPVKKGKNYLVNNLWGPEVHFAINNQLNTGIMTSWLFAPIAITAKYSITQDEDKKVHYSLGSILGWNSWIPGDLNKNDFFGLHWASLTLGNRQNNFTLSGGWFFKTNLNTLMFDEIKDPQISNNIIDSWLLSENNYSSYFADALNRNGFKTTSSSTQPITHGPMVSCSFVAKIGQKASLIFDNILVFPNVTRENVNLKITNYPDNSGTDVKPGSGSLTITHETKVDFWGVVMPGMRFERKNNSAFQFVVAIVNYQGTYSDRRQSFPVPYLSWYKSF